MTSGITTEISALLSNTSARTLLLGIDKTGRIIQHDRSAADILAYPRDALLGVEFGNLIVGPSGYDEAIEGLLSAALADREGTAVLTLRTGKGELVDSVVTMQPMRSTDPTLAALAVVRIPPASEGRFLDPAVMRRALLDGAFKRIGGALDIDQLAREFVNIVVPHFSNSAGLLLLESMVGGDELPVTAPDGSHLLRRLAVAYDDGDPAWDAAFPTGEILRYPPGTPYTQCMDSGGPVRETTFGADSVTQLAASWMRRPVARLLAGTSMLLLPLVARDLTLGFFVCTRTEGYRRFDAYDTEIGMEFASRSAIFIARPR